MDGNRRRARTLGFDYIENEQLLAHSAEKRFERLEALVERGLINDSGARAAVLGTARRPPFLLSKLFIDYEAATKDEIKGFSNRRFGENNSPQGKNHLLISDVRPSAPRP